MPLVLREPKPGDMGWMVCRHGEIYHTEYGWGTRFEAIVAQIVADFMANHDPDFNRCWIAEIDGKRAGCVMLVKADGETAKLRTLLVEPDFRGCGVGRALVRACVDFAQRAGYARVVLWTNSVLSDARRIYEHEGFRMTEESPHDLFGDGLIGQTWQLDLKGARR